jgi:hypothetical protein
METKFICCNFLERNNANIRVFFVGGGVLANSTDLRVTQIRIPTKKVTEACVLDYCEGYNWIYAGDTTSPCPLPMTWSSITLRHTTLGRNPLVEWSACRSAPLRDNTQRSQEALIHATGGIRTRNLSKPATVDPRLRRPSHWDRQNFLCCKPKFKFGNVSTINLNVVCQHLFVKRI